MLGASCVSNTLFFSPSAFFSGSHDVDYKIRLFETFFNAFEQVDAELKLDE